VYQDERVRDGDDEPGKDVLLYCGKRKKSHGSQDMTASFLALYCHISFTLRDVLYHPAQRTCY
jgi:hypothetical protein